MSLISNRNLRFCLLNYRVARLPDLSDFSIPEESACPTGTLQVSKKFLICFYAISLCWRCKILSAESCVYFSLQNTETACRVPLVVYKVSAPRHSCCVALLRRASFQMRFMKRKIWLINWLFRLRPEPVFSILSVSELILTARLRWSCGQRML